MSNSAGYLRSDDGAYDAADNTKKYSITMLQVLPRFLMLLVMVLPRLLMDFVRAYIWAPKKSILGQVALVTGGGNGFGKALCLRLAQEGCSIAIADIDMISAQKTAEEIRQLGCRVKVFKVDVSDLRSVQQLRIDVESKLGPVDILVNNAGLLTTFSLSEGSAEDVRRVFDVNLMSHLWTIREFKDGMIQRGLGHIVGISSILGFFHSSRAASYCTTKFAIRGLMRCLDEEFFQLGLENKVTATCVYPVFMYTRQSLINMIVERGLFPVLFTAERVANITVDGILQNCTEIIAAPFYIRILMKIYEFFPLSYQHAISTLQVSPANVKRFKQK
ncbi:17-beta-hydroxysteroid dehydrogenase 13-like [Wyeomyia smithii]|uniref:17-beta-hydroxysteroid dehydrogenase 13-like n=1 Tax=Wyeomyia smithii TaxID=174621 RepID=UPI002467B754|nr:17-beta-hydroxysteroid dehydrogenase 13-like [Wyeomyia smithii]